MSKIPKISKDAGELPDDVAGQTEVRRVRRKQAAEPKVGIFFVLGKQLWIDSTPVTDAQAFAGMKTHEQGHDVFWEKLQECDAVSRDVEYNEIPSGRVTFDADKREYHLFVDPCIRKAADMIDKILDEMNLPSATKVELDSHYRCPGCMPHADESLEA